MRLAAETSRERGITLLLFLALAFIYLASPNRHLSDSRFTLLTSEAILRSRNLDLSPFALAETPTRRDPPQLIRWHGQLITIHPAGTSILALPVVSLARVVGLRIVDPEGRYDETVELRIQGIVAALLSAGTGVLLYALARRDLAPRQALVIAAAASLGSSIWSTASRVLWSQTGAVALLAGALVEMRGCDEGAESGRPRRLALLLLAAVLVRPSLAPIACLFAADLFLRHRHLFKPFAFTAVSGLAVMLALHRTLAGSFLPPYVIAHAKSSQNAMGFAEALAGHLVAPSRGLIVFSPIVLAALWLPMRHGVRSEQRGIARLCLAACCLHWVLVSRPCVWWGGGSYGPRLMLEAVPFLVVLASLGWRRARDLVPESGRELPRVVVSCLVAASLYMHATGALSPAALQWNARPVPVSRQPDRVWDWRDPQFLAWTDRPALRKDLWPPPSRMPCPSLAGELLETSSHARPAPGARTSC